VKDPSSAGTEKPLIRRPAAPPMWRGGFPYPQGKRKNTAELLTHHGGKVLRPKRKRRQRTESLVNNR